MLVSTWYLSSKGKRISDLGKRKKGKNIAYENTERDAFIVGDESGEDDEEDQVGDKKHEEIEMK